MNERITHSPTYTSKVFDPTQFTELVTKTTAAVKRLMKRYGKLHLAATGMSGTPLVAAVAARLKLPMLLVRPKGGSAHDVRQVNGTFDPEVGTNYIIIDDLIDTGTTAKRIIAEVNVAVDRARRDYCIRTMPDFKCVGILLYESPKGWDVPLDSWYGDQLNGIRCYDLVGGRFRKA